MAAFLTGVRWNFTGSFDLHFPDDFLHYNFFYGFTGYLYYFFLDILNFDPLMDWFTWNFVGNF